MSDDKPAEPVRDAGPAGLKKLFAPDSIYTSAVRRYLLARFSAAAAFQIQGVAVGWYIYELTDSPLWLGLVGLAMFLPTAGLALFAGQAIDQYSRRNVLLAAWSVQAAAALGIATLAVLGLGRVDVIFVLIMIYGAGRAFEQPAQAAILPSLVPAAVFPRIVPASSMVNQFAVVLGPALGGLLYIFGAPVAFFGAVAVTLIALGAVFSLPKSPPKAAQPLSWKSFISGISFIRHAEAVRGAITLDMFGVFFGGATALLPIFARDILMVGPVGLGLLRSAPALGAMSAGLWLTRHPLERHVGNRMLIAVAFFGAATIVFGISQSLPLTIAALIATGAADCVSVVVRHTLVQTATPNAIRGRVSAVNSLFVGTSNQLGEFESGVTAEWFGAVGSVMIGGTATILIVAAAAGLFPALRKMDRYVMAPDMYPEEEKKA
jgi:MFS family permease